MADDTPSESDKRPGDPTEGVRIIGAEEAAEAFERGDVASRRGGDTPRYGDRPEPPPVGTRPALRFPLEASADPTRIEKPAPRSSGIEFEPLGGPPRGQRYDPLPKDGSTPPEPDAEPDPEPEPPAAAEPVSTPVELPHWSEPPTGEVPKVLAAEGEEEDLDAWSSFASSAPRWRDSGEREWEHGEGMHDVLGEDSSWRVGAMDESRPTEEELFSFADIDSDADAGAEPADDTAAADLDLSWEDAPEAEPVPVGGRGGRARPESRRAPASRNPVADWASGGGGGIAPPTSSGRNVPVAAGVGIAFAGLYLFLCYLGPKYAVALVAAALGLAAVEFFNTVRRAGYHAATLLGIVATVAFPLAVYWKGPAAYPVMAALIVITTLVWHLVESDPEVRVVESVGLTLLGIGWIGGLGSFAALMLAPITTPDGTGFLTTAILATVAYDVGGFFVGRAAGTRQLSAASPNKTVEGLVGGVVVSVVVTAIVVGGFGLAPFDSFGDAVIIALAAASVAWLGDLCESLVKRDLGVKDMGSILPEHGGLFDRIDAMLFVAPVVYFAAIAFDLLVP